MRKILHIALFAAAFLSVFFMAAPAKAQLILVTGDYRVVIVDKGEQRLGIAKRDADPNRRQNWVYVKGRTEIVRRVWLENRAFRDEKLTWDEFFTIVKKGTCLRVHGGRDWDGSIDAKKIWF